MPTFIRHPKDFWTGTLFLFVGLAAVILGQDYPMGTAGKMGPAYFPTVLGSLLALIGATAVIRSLVRNGEPVGKFYVKEIILILSAVLLFGVLMRGAGLIVAVVVLIVLSAYASPKFHLGSALLLAGGLAAFSVLVFVKLLGLPMPMIGPWFGF